MTTNSPLVMLTPATAAAAVGRWFRVILPHTTLRGRVTGVVDGGTTLLIDHPELASIHLDVTDVWVENDS